MQHAPATLADVVNALADVPPDIPTVFTTKAGEIGAGYHVTELKLAEIQSIDCGAQRDDWREAQVQLLDGAIGGHMKAGRLSAILTHSIREIPGLAEVPFSIEYAPGNQGLSRYKVGRPQVTDGRLTVPLEDDRAQCKAATRFSAAPNASGKCCD